MISPRRTKKPRRALDYPRSGGSSVQICPLNHHLRSCSTAPAVGAKRAGTRARTASRRAAKRPRILDDPAAGFSAHILSWGAKRARTAHCSAAQIRGDYVQYCSAASQIPTWGKKRARSSGGPPPPLHPASVPSRPEWRDWANLGEGPAGLIAECLLANDVADYMSFRAVCRPWRFCSTDPSTHGVLDCRFHPRQWIMLRETVATPHHRRLLNVSTGHCITMDLPELRGQEVFGPTAEGLLVLLDRTSYAVRLLNPITHQVADLPPANTLLPSKMRNDPRLLLQVSGAGLADESTFAVHFFVIETLVVAKPGQDHWTVVHRGNLVVTPAMSFAGRFYGVTKNKVMVVETSTDRPPRLALAAKLARAFSRMLMESVHLVDNDGELMLVDREQGGRIYNVYRVDLDARKMVPVHGLGGRTVFISSEQALSVSPSVFPSIAADAVYSGFNSLLFPGNLEKSPYHLKDGTAEPRDFNYFGSDLFTGEVLKYSCYGPWGVDDYLSSCITGFRDGSEDTIASSPTW